MGALDEGLEIYEKIVTGDLEIRMVNLSVRCGPLLAAALILAAPGIAQSQGSGLFQKADALMETANKAQAPLLSPNN
jgi:hypothetical protein